jgi:hypothetical protein
LVDQFHPTTDIGKPDRVHRILASRALDLEKPSFDTSPNACHSRRMLKLCILGTSCVASYVFWWVADLLGAEFFVSFMISGVGAIVGCWIGWKIHQRFLN